MLQIALRVACVAISLIAQAYGNAFGEESRPLFRPGQLAITYKSATEADQALAQLRGPEAPPRLRGTDGGFDVTKSNSTTLTLQFHLPSVRGGSVSELDVLQDLAEALKASDPRIESATPVWIYYNPPAETLEGTGAKLEPQSDISVSSTPPPGTRDFIVFKDGPDPRVQAAPNDALFYLQWDYLPPPRGMNAVDAWQVTRGNSDIVVAVIDTGIQPNHPDFRQANHVLPGVTFVTSRQRERRFCKDEPQWGGRATDPGDDRAYCRGPAGAVRPDLSLQPSFHGTHVAGTIGAVGTDNAVGIAGVAWNVTILPLRVLTSDGGTNLDIIDAMKWAAGLPVEGLPRNDHPADIINMSLGGPNLRRDPVSRQWVFASCDKSDPFWKALSEVRKAGTVVVVAAGNGEKMTADGRPCTSDDDACTRKPVDVKYENLAGCPGVISVAASDMYGHLARYSNFGAVTITAPGGDIYTGSVTIADSSGNQKIVFGRILLSDGTTVQQQARYGGILSTRDDGYYWENGTSMAAPHVAGAISLLLSAHPEFRRKPELIEKAIRASAVRPPQGACPTNQPCGPGLLDAAKLIGPAASLASE